MSIGPDWLVLSSRNWVNQSCGTGWGSRMGGRLPVSPVGRGGLCAVAEYAGLIGTVGGAHSGVTWGDEWRAVARGGGSQIAASMGMRWFETLTVGLSGGAARG